MTFKISDGILLGRQVVLDRDRVMTAMDYNIKENYATVKPNIDLDFTRKTLDSRLTFTRNSIATYWSQDKHTAISNLLHRNEDVSTTTKRSVTVATAAITPPANTKVGTVFLVSETTTANDVHYFYYNFGGNASWSNSGNLLSDGRKLTYSVYLKAGTTRYVTVTIGSTASETDGFASVTIDLQTGIVTQNMLAQSIVFKTFSHKVVSAGDGWYRVSITCVGSRYFLIGPTNAPTLEYTTQNFYGFGRYTGVTTNNFYACGLQMEYGENLSAYEPNLTDVVKDETMRTLKVAKVNQPRLECDPITGDSKGLLVERSSTNIIRYSQNIDYSNGVWATANNINGYAGTGLAPILTPNAGYAPDGSFTASRVILDLNGGTTSNDRSGLYQSFTVTVGLSYSSSIFVKILSGTTIQNLTTWLFGAFGASQTQPIYKYIEEVGGGWYRVMINNIVPTVTNATFRIQLSGDSNVDKKVDLLVWGAQVEPTNFASSYIPTTSAAVTRSVDLCVMPIDKFPYNTTQGTIYSETISSAMFFKDMYRGNVNSLSIDNGTIQNRWQIRLSAHPTDANYPYPYARTRLVSTDTSIDYPPSTNIELTDFDPDNPVKMAFAVSPSYQKFYVNGEDSLLPQTTVTLPTATQMVIGSGIGGDYLSGNVKRIRYYNTALSAENLKVLTA